MSNTNHDFIVKNGLVVGSAITSTGTLTQAGQTFPASDGSANQYLKTNGSGALSWGTVNTSFNITDGTTTDAVGLTETVTFTGGTNISLAVTDNTVTITNDVTDTDDITEGSSNLFYTDTRAVDAVEGHAHLTIDGGTLYVDTANNYVGIGDTSPSGKLDVAGNIMINGSEVIDASGNIVGSVSDSAMTVGGSLAGVLSNLKVQYGTSYSGTPIQGSFFFDSLNQKLKVYTGSAFIDAVPAGSGGGGGGGATDANTTFRNYSYTLTGTTSAVSGVDDNELTAGAFIIGHKYTITATGNTNFVTIGAANSNVNTVFTATGVGTGTGTAKQTLFYDTTSSATRVVAYVNGIKQVYGSGRDFVATTGTSVAFTYNLGSGDTVDLQVYELLTNAAYYLKSETLATTAVNSNIATAVADYLPLAGGTLTGNLTVQTLVGINKAVNSSVGLSVGSDAAAATSYGLEVTNNSSNTRFLVDGLGSQRFYGSDNSETARFTDGKLGIGIASPGAKLSVSGPAALVNLGGGSTGSSALYVNSTSGHTGELIQVLRNSATKMHMANDGKLGLGTSSPQQLLHVYNASSGVAARIEGPNAYNSESGLEFSLGRARISGVINGSGGTPGAALKFMTMPNGGSITSRMLIDSNGNVGIGTDNPGYPLQVNGDVDILNVKGSSGNAFVRFTDSDASADFSIGADDGSGAGPGAFILYDRSNSAYRLMVDSSGKVLVGTTSNSYNRGKFTVFGTPGNPATTGTNVDNVAIRVATTTGNSQSFDIGMYNSGDYGAWLQASNSGSLNNHSPIILNPNGGNIGIGTSAPLTTLMLESTGGNLTSGNAIKSSTMKGLTLNAQEGNAHTNSLGVWFGSNGSHWSGIAGGRSDTSTWGTDLRFYTHEDNAADLTYSRERMVITEAGNVGIGVQVPTAALDVRGVFNSEDNVSSTVTGASSTVHNLTNRSRISGKINIPIEVYFANGTSNLCIRLYFSGSSLWFGGEVLMGATYSNAGAQGFRRYSFGHNQNGSNNYGSYLSNTENMGVTSSHFSFDSHGWDSSENAHYFEFRHLASSGNSLWIQFEGHSSAPSTAFSGNWYYKHKTF